MCLRLTSQGLLGNYTDARNDLERAARDVRVNTKSTLQLDVMMHDASTFFSRDSSMHPTLSSIVACGYQQLLYQLF